MKILYHSFTIACVTRRQKPPIQKYFTKYFSTVKQNKYSINIHISFEEFIQYTDLIIFKDIFYKNLNLSTKYSYIVKVGKDNIFFTLSERQNFFILDKTPNDQERFDTLNDYLLTNISRILDVYKDVIQDQSVDIITFIFFPIDLNFEEVKPEIKNIDDIKSITSKANVVNIKKQFSIFDNEILNIKGIPLEVDTINKTFIYIPEDLEFFNFDNVKYVDNSKYFSIKYRGKTYVIVEYIEDGITIKQCLDKFGISLHTAEEKSLQDGGIIRKLGNFHTHYNSDKEVVEIKKDLSFQSISSNFKVNNKLSVNDNIGVIDLETFKKDEISLCYAIGYYTDKDSNMFYIDKDNKDSNIIIHNCILELLDTKFKKYIFYCHNLGGFDAPFILKALLHYNKNVEVIDRYIFDIFTRENSIIRLTIKKRVNGKIKSVTIHDSLPILSMSLRDLCKAYNVESSKSYFPYKFVNENTLFYKGVTPDKSYYEIQHSKDNTDFNLFYTNNFSNLWDLKAETLKYLELDLKSLYEVLKIVNLHMFLLFDIQMTENSTISGIAMRTFLDKYYKNTTDKIPLINSNQIYNDIYNAYYGGRVEVFIPKPINNEKLYYYDVNSLYPFASLNDLPGLQWHYNEFTKSPNLDKLFGFYYCKVETNGSYFGLLPYRNDKGGLSFPKGKWYGWYFSEELKLAQNNGYKIEVLRGYTSDRSQNIFTDFVKNIFEVKLNPKNKAEKNVAKLILNSLIGRFGMNPEKMVTKILNRKEHNIVNSTRVLKNSITLDDDNYLDTFSTNINKDVCKEFGLDYVKVLNTNKFNFKKGRPISNNTISISTAAAILSYSRIYMAETILSILNKGGRIYYTDTDSIITNIKLSSHITDPKELGKFKLENELIEAYFISDKTYLIKNIKGHIIKKAKSVKEDSLDITDYKRFYNLEVYESAVKTTSKKDFKAGSVNISSKLVTLNVDKYTKRERVFENNKWVNSKPIYINNIDKSIIVHINLPTSVLIRTYNNLSIQLYRACALNTSLIPYNNNLSLQLYRACALNTSLIPYNNNLSLQLYRACALNTSLKLYNNNLFLDVYKFTPKYVSLYNYINNDFSIIKIETLSNSLIITIPITLLSKFYWWKEMNVLTPNLDYLTTSSYSTSITTVEDIEDSDDTTSTVNESNYRFNKGCFTQNLCSRRLANDKYSYNINVFILCIIYTIQIYLIKLLLKSYTPIFWLSIYLLLNIYNNIYLFIECTDFLDNILETSKDIWCVSYGTQEAYLDNTKDIINLNLNSTVVTIQESNDVNKVVPLEDKSQINITYKYRALLLRHFKMLDFSTSNAVDFTFTKGSVNTKDLTDYLQNKYSNVLDKEFIGLTTTSHDKFRSLNNDKIFDSVDIIDSCTVSEILNLEVKPNNNQDFTNIPKDLSSKINILNDNISNYKNIVNSRDGTIESLIEDSNNLKNKTSDLNSNLNSNELKIMDLESRVIEDSNKIKELTDEIYSLKSNRTSLNSEVEKYEDLLKYNNQIIDDNYKKIYKLDDEISELNNKINFLKKIKYDYEKVLKSNDDELFSYYNENKALKVEVDKFKSKTLNLIKELEIERSKTEEYLLWYDDTVKQLNDVKVELIKLKQKKYSS